MEPNRTLCPTAPALAYDHSPDKIRPPCDTASLEFLDGFTIDIVLLSEGLDEGLVVEGYIQSFGEFFSDRAATAAEFAVDGYYEFFFSVHNCEFNDFSQQ